MEVKSFDLSALTKFLALTNADGTPIMVGPLTLSQVLGIVIALILIVVVIVTIKSAIRFVFSVLIIAIAAITFHVTTPEEIYKNVNTTIEQTKETVDKAGEVVDEAGKVVDQTKDTVEKVKGLTGE